MNEAEILDRIGRYLRQADGQYFIDRVQERQKRAMSSLKNNIDLLEIGRNQGQLVVLDWILRMREEGV